MPCLYFEVSGPVQEIVLLALRLLGEEVVGEADRQLPLVRELLDDGVVFRIVLEAAAGIDGAGDAEPVELAHEMPGRIHLVFEGQLRSLRQRRVEDVGVRLGEQQPGRIAVGVAHDLAARRLRGVLGVADGAQRRAIQDGAIVEVQEEDRRVGRDGVEFIDGRQALLGELMFGEAAHDAHPLRWRRDRDLLLQHGHGIGQRPHAVPAQFHVEVEPAADDVKMIVDQSGQHAAAFQVDHLGRRARPAP